MYLPFMPESGEIPAKSGFFFSYASNRKSRLSGEKFGLFVFIFFIFKNRAQLDLKKKKNL